jgi:hypothetical protein
MEGLEITIMKEDESIVDLEGDDISNKIDEFQAEFEKTCAGQALIADGYTVVDTDADDINLSLVYRKE